MVTQKQDGTVEFTFFGPAASQVALAGDFNNWQTEAQHLRRDENGWWKLNLKLQPGEYRFKYLVDGAMWQADYAAFGVELDRVSGFRSVLWVRPAASSASATSAPAASPATMSPAITVKTTVRKTVSSPAAQKTRTAAAQRQPATAGRGRAA